MFRNVKSAQTKQPVFAPCYCSDDGKPKCAIACHTQCMTLHVILALTKHCFKVCTVRVPRPSLTAFSLLLYFFYLLALRLTSKAQDCFCGHKSCQVGGWLECGCVLQVQMSVCYARVSAHIMAMCCGVGWHETPPICMRVCTGYRTIAIESHCVLVLKC